MDTLIIGAGGHGTVVLDIIRAAGRHHVIGFIDADPALAGTAVGGLPVLGAANLLSRLRSKARAGIVAIGDNRARMEYIRMVVEGGFELLNAVHPSAHVSSSAVLGRNVVVAAGATISTDARIGDGAIVNTGAIVDHECDIGPGAHVAPGAALAGKVRVGSGAFVGLGSRVIQCLSIGDFAVVGAGAVVLRDVPPHSTVVGVPARTLSTKMPLPPTFTT